MEPHKSALERAFDLARSGRFDKASEVKLAVAAEGYDRRQLDGRSLTRQLADLIRSSRPA